MVVYLVFGSLNTNSTHLISSISVTIYYPSTISITLPFQNQDKEEPSGCSI